MNEVMWVLYPEIRRMIERESLFEIISDNVWLGNGDWILYNTCLKHVINEDWKIIPRLLTLMEL